jgi:hypothetical protein
LTGDIPLGGSVLEPPTDTIPTLAKLGLDKKRAARDRYL